MPIGSSNLTASIWVGDSDSSYALKKYDGTAAPNAVTGKNVTDTLGLNVSGIRGVNFLWDFDNGLSLRLGHARGSLSIESNASQALIATTALVAAPFAAATRSTFTADGAKATFSGVGAVYDSGDYILSAEFTKRRTESYVTSTTGYYLVGGYRVGKFTPFVGVSKLKVDKRADNPFAVLGSGNALYKSAEALLNTQKVGNRTTSLGLRWEAASSLAVKMQWDRMSKPADSTGVFFDPSNNFIAEKRRVDAMSLSVDFVF